MLYGDWASPNVNDNIIILYNVYKFLLQLNRNYDAMSYVLNIVLLMFSKNFKKHIFFVRRLMGLAMIDMYTKFEVSTFSRSTDILRALKVQNGSLDVAMPISGTVFNYLAATVCVKNTYYINTFCYFIFIRNK